MVEVEEAGVEFFTGGGFDFYSELGKERIPREGCFGFAGIGVIQALIAKPSNLARSGDGFAEHFDDVVLPWDFMEKEGEELVCFGECEDGAQIEGLTIFGEEILRREEIESHGDFGSLGGDFIVFQ